MKKDLQFTLIKDGNRFILEHSPIGWNDEIIRPERNMDKYYGMFRTFTIPLKFVKDGATLIRQAFYLWNAMENSSSYEALMFIEIAKLNKLTLEYGQPFRGELNFSTFIDESGYVTITVIEGGLSAIIKAKEAQVVELTLPTDQVMKYDGVILDPEDVQLDGTGVGPLLTNVGIEEIPLDVTTFADTGQGAFTVQSVDDQTNPRAFIICNRNGAVKLDFDISCHFTIDNGNSGNTVTFSTILRIKRVTSVNEDILLDAYTRWVTGGGNYDSNNDGGHDFTFSTDQISLQEGDEVWLLAQVSATASLDFVGTGYGPVSIVGKLWYLLPPIQFRIYPIWQLLQAWFAEVAPDYTIKSDFFSTIQDSHAYDQLLLTCGSAIRNQKEFRLSETGEMITTYLPQLLKITWEELFKSIDTIFCLGMGIEIINDVETLVIEKRQYFFDSAVSENIGSVRDFKLSVANELLFNQIKIGYPDQNYGEDTGRNEVNSTQKYSVPVTRVVKEIDLVSKYRADFYGIDYYRVKFAAEENTKDDAADNQIFMLSGTPITGQTWQWELLRAPFYSQNGGGISGIVFPTTAYNLYLTPGHCMLKHHAWFNSILHNNSFGYIRFLSGDKNTRVETRDNDFGLVREDENNIATGPDLEKLFLPYYFEFICNLSVENLDMILNHYKAGDLLEFTWKGKTLSGFLLDARIRMSGHSECAIKLLADKNCDLTQLTDERYSIIVRKNFTDGETYADTFSVTVTGANTGYSQTKSFSVGSPAIFSNLYPDIYTVEEAAHWKYAFYNGTNIQEVTTVSGTPLYYVDVFNIPAAIMLKFDNTINAPVIDRHSVFQWNTFFQLPTLGTEFSLCEVFDATGYIYLWGGKNITGKNNLFKDNIHLLELTDLAGVFTSVQDVFCSGDSELLLAVMRGITQTGIGAFQLCPKATFDMPALVTAGNLTFNGSTQKDWSFPAMQRAGNGCWQDCRQSETWNLPLITIISQYSFLRCYKTKTLYMPMLLTLATTIGNDYVFYDVAGNEIDLTIPDALMHLNYGNPEGDIAYLIANNTVNLTLTT
ncbi:MAG: hypothetical protein ACOYMF_06025 [Bacteroidales bacterium]